MSWSCQGHVRVVSGLCQDLVRVMSRVLSGSCQGFVKLMSGFRQGRVRVVSGSVRVVSGFYHRGKYFQISDEIVIK